MAKVIEKKKSCIVCGHKNLFKYLDLGKSALANSYLKKSDLQKPEPKFPLRVYYCPNCHLAQLFDWVDRKALFEYYAYLTGKSWPMHEHFRKYAEDVYRQFPNQAKQLTLDIGSNDGFLLKCFQDLGGKILGVDPAKNIVRTANKSGIKTLPVFFDLAVARKILKGYGQAGVITANNVLAHTDNLAGIIAGVKNLLHPNGVFIFEVQYLGDLIRNNEFDNTYHEHICYFSLTPLTKLLSQSGLQIFDVEKVNTQGGSIRVYAGTTPNPFPVKNSVRKILLGEKSQGLQNSKTYKKFGMVPKKIKKDLVELLTKLKKQNKTIVGYGAAAKGNTLLQYCEIGPDLIDYIVDTTPSKQGKFTPGTHIPIYSPKHLKKETPDYVLILAWNYADLILKKEVALKKKGVKFIVPIPKVKIV